MSICDDETPRIYFEGDVRAVRDTGVNIYCVVVDIDVLLFDFDAVLFRADALRVRAVLTVYVAHHPLHRRGPLSPHFAQQYTSLRGRSRRLRDTRSRILIRSVRLRLLRREVDGREDLVLCMADVEGEESSVLGDDRQVCFGGEIPCGGSAGGKCVRCTVRD